MPAIGGLNISDFYTCNTTAGTMGTTRLIRLDRKIKTDVSRTSLTIDQNQDNEALTTFCNTYAPISISSGDSGDYENGAKFNSATASSPSVISVTYGAKDLESSPAKRKVLVQVLKLAEDVGAISMEAGKYTKPKIAGEVFNNETAITVPSSIFDSTVVTVAGNLTIPASVGYLETWVTAVGPI